MNIKNWINFAEKKLIKSSTTPRLDALLILAYGIKKPFSWIMSFNEKNINFKEKKK
ncbi:hypothetical protein RJT62_00770 [Buchnera aphidicola (Mindarus keteleerifoliae)]|uniref:hypothetical protein n=1 Tax=Buchnera aphidicola TaxID=9 RepID=UPI0031B6D603